ncbi:hypothetical protein ABEB36_014339 [Hypothenemus hampei]|uniref:Uncharacterized protein n=1 Tax=Hypothenemus hampei TaxID=57062 RepID=A0ABD1E8N5_HYPHA
MLPDSSGTEPTTPLADPYGSTKNPDHLRQHSIIPGPSQPGGYAIVPRFWGPIRMTNFKIHPSWEEPNVVVRIWTAWINYEKACICGKGHLLTIRIEFNMNFMMYCMALRAVLKSPSTEEKSSEFPLFYPLSKKRCIAEDLKILTRNVNCETELLEVGRSHAMNFIETNLLSVYRNKINGNALEKLKKKLQEVTKLDMTRCNEYLIEVEFNNNVLRLRNLHFRTIEYLYMMSFCTKIKLKTVDIKKNSQPEAFSHGFLAIIILEWQLDKKVALLNTKLTATI